MQSGLQTRASLDSAEAAAAGAFENVVAVSKWLERANEGGDEGEADEARAELEQTERTLARLQGSRDRLQARRDRLLGEFHDQQGIVGRLEIRLRESGVDPAGVDARGILQMGARRRVWRTEPATALQREGLHRLLQARSMPTSLLDEPLTRQDADTATRTLLAGLPMERPTDTPGPDRPGAVQAQSEPAQQQEASAPRASAVKGRIRTERDDELRAGMLDEIGRAVAADPEISAAAGERNAAAEEFFGWAVPAAKSRVLSYLANVLETETGAGDESRWHTARELLVDLGAWKNLPYTIADTVWQARHGEPDESQDTAADLAEQLAVASAGDIPDAETIQDVVDAAADLIDSPEIQRQSIIQDALERVHTATGVDWAAVGRAEFDPDRLLAEPDPDAHPAVAAALARLNPRSTNAARISTAYLEGWRAGRGEFTRGTWEQIKQEIASHPDVIAAVRESGRSAAELAGTVGSQGVITNFALVIAEHLSSMEKRGDLHTAAILDADRRSRSTRASSLDRLAEEIAEAAIPIAREGWSPPFRDAAGLTSWRRIAERELRADPLIRTWVGLPMTTQRARVLEEVVERTVALVTDDNVPPESTAWLAADIYQHVHPNLELDEPEEIWGDYGGGDGSWSPGDPNVRIGWIGGSWQVTRDGWNTAENWGSDHRAALVEALRLTGRDGVHPILRAEEIHQRVREARDALSERAHVLLTGHELIQTVARSEHLMRSARRGQVDSNARWSPLTREAVGDVVAELATQEPHLINDIEDVGIDAFAYLRDAVAVAALTELRTGRQAAQTTDLRGELHVLNSYSVTVGDPAGDHVTLTEQTSEDTVTKWVYRPDDALEPLISSTIAAEAIAAARRFLLQPLDMPAQAVDPEATVERSVDVTDQPSGKDLSAEVATAEPEVLPQALDLNPAFERYGGYTGGYNGDYVIHAAGHDFVVRLPSKVQRRNDIGVWTARPVTGAWHADTRIGSPPRPADIMRVVRQHLRDQAAQEAWAGQDSHAATASSETQLTLVVDAVLAVAGDSHPLIELAGLRDPDLYVAFAAVSAEHLVQDSLTDLFSDAPSHQLSEQVRAFAEQARASQFERARVVRRVAGRVWSAAAAPDADPEWLMEQLFIGNQRGGSGIDVGVSPAFERFDGVGDRWEETEEEQAGVALEFTAGGREFTFIRWDIDTVDTYRYTIGVDQAYYGSETGELDPADSPAEILTVVREFLLKETQWEAQQLAERTAPHDAAELVGELAGARGWMVDEHFRRLHASDLRYELTLNGPSEFGDEQIRFRWDFTAPWGPFVYVPNGSTRHVDGVRWQPPTVEEARQLLRSARLAPDEVEPSAVTAAVGVLQWASAVTPQPLSRATIEWLTNEVHADSARLARRAWDAGWYVELQTTPDRTEAELVLRGQLGNGQREIRQVWIEEGDRFGYVPDRSVDIYRHGDSVTRSAPDLAQVAHVLDEPVQVLPPGTTERFAEVLADVEGDSIIGELVADHSLDEYRTMAAARADYLVTSYALALVDIAEAAGDITGQRAAQAMVDNELARARLIATIVDSVWQQLTDHNPAQVPAPHAPEIWGDQTDLRNAVLDEALALEALVVPDTVDERDRATWHERRAGYFRTRVARLELAIQAATVSPPVGVDVADLADELDDTQWALDRALLLAAAHERTVQLLNREVTATELDGNQVADLASAVETVLESIARQSPNSDAHEHTLFELCATLELDDRDRQVIATAITEFRTRGTVAATSAAELDSATPDRPVEQILTLSAEEVSAEPVGAAQVQQVLQLDPAAERYVALQAGLVVIASGDQHFLIGGLDQAQGRRGFEIWTAAPDAGGSEEPWARGESLGEASSPSEIMPLIRDHVAGEQTEASVTGQAAAFTDLSGQPVELDLIRPFETYSGQDNVGRHVFDVGGDTYLADSSPNGEAPGYRVYRAELSARDDGSPSWHVGVEIGRTADPQLIPDLIRDHHNGTASEHAEAHAQWLEQNAPRVLEVPPAAARIAARARANGWTVTEVGPHGDRWLETYELTLQAYTDRGPEYYRLPWQTKRGYLSYNGQRAAGTPPAGYTGRKTYRPKLTDVERAVQNPAIAPPEPVTEPVTETTVSPEVEPAVRGGGQLDMFAGHDDDPTPMEAPPQDQADLPLVPQDEDGVLMSQWAGRTLTEARRPDGTRVFVTPEILARRALVGEVKPPPSRPEIMVGHIGPAESAPGPEFAAQLIETFAREHTTPDAVEQEPPDTGHVEPVETSDEATSSGAVEIASATNVVGAEVVGTNYRLGTEVLAPSGVRERIRANIAAIAIVKQLQRDDRPATADEQNVLARWAGWGGAWQVFDTDKSEFDGERAQLRELLTDTEFAAARKSTINAHYTDPAISAVMWRELVRAGLPDDARVLEPGCGSGHFIGAAPETIRMVGVELDPVTASIAHALYPGHSIRNHGFERDWADDASFDSVIGNVPFGNFRAGYDFRHNPDGLSIHNHFIRKSLALTKPGGYVAVITSTYTSDGTGTRPRQAIAEFGDLLGAIRLPTDTFAAQAKTAVVTDLLVFRRRDEDQPLSPATKQWVGKVAELDVGTAADPKKLKLNEYFRSNPENVLGRLDLGQGKGGRTALVVHADTTRPLADQLSDRLRSIIDSALEADLGLDVEVTAAEVVAEAGLTGAEGLEKPQVPGTLRFDEKVGQFESYQATSGWTAVPKKSAAKVREWRAMLEMGDIIVALGEAARTYSTPDERQRLRDTLNEKYDNYVKQYGPINRFKWTDHPSRNSDLAAARKYDRLETRWRKKHGDSKKNDAGKRVIVPFAGEVPAEVVLELREESYEPDQKPYRKRGHLEGAIKFEPRIALVRGIELFDDETGVATKSSIFTEDVSQVLTRATSATDIDEAIAISFSEAGTIQPERMAELLGTTVQDVLVQARGKIYPNQFHPDEWVHAAKALSGHLRDKLAHAKTLAREDPEKWQPLVEAITDAIPPDVDPAKIGVRPGAHWIPVSIYREFLQQEFELRPPEMTIEYSAASSTWYITSKKTPRRDLWGVPGAKIDGLELFAKICNNEAIESRKTAEELERSPRPSFHPERTNMLRANAEQLEKRFDEWLWSNPDRTDQLTRKFNHELNSFADVSYPGTGRHYPGLNPAITPYAYQNRAITRWLAEGVIMLDHEVGSGKTLTIAIACMEMRRLGMTRQPWIVMPNHLNGNWQKEIQFYYPTAKILVGTDLDGPVARQRFLAASATADWDMVLVDQSVFTLIKLSPEAQAEYIERQIEIMLEVKNSLNEDTHRMSVKDIETAIEKERARVEDLLEPKERRSDDGIFFERGGCTLYVRDEAHEIRRLPRPSKSADLALLDGSQRATDSEMKIIALREAAIERNIASGRPDAPTYIGALATGTPIVNNLAELWVWIRLLRPDLLENRGMMHVDGWAQVFAKMRTTVEMNITATKLRSVSRMREYNNLPQLRAMVNQFRDVVTKKQITAKLPKLADGKHTRVEYELSQDVRDFMHDLDWRNRNMDSDRPDIDNPLKVGNDGKAVSLYPPLGGLAQPEPENDRVALCAERIWNRHVEYSDFSVPEDSAGPAADGIFQIVFCDVGTPKIGDGPDADTIYNQLRKKIHALGEGHPLQISLEEIAFIHDFPTARDKMDMTAKAKAGKIRVLVGSSPKMATGLNVQRLAKSLSHLSLAQTAADYIQRDGRVIRQGNRHDEVEIDDFVAIRSYDAVAWQRLEQIVHFIEQFREGDDIAESLDADAFNDGFEVTAAQAKAAATGDPVYVAVVELEARVKTLKAEQSSIAQVNQTNHHVLRRLKQSLPIMQSALQERRAIAEPLKEWAATDRAARTITIGGDVVRDDDNEALVEKTQALLADEVIRLRMTRSRDKVAMFEVAGVTVFGNLEPMTGKFTFSTDGDLAVSMDAEIVTEAMSTNTKTRGLLTRIRNMLGDAGLGIGKMVDDIDDIEARIATLEANPDRVFDNLDELREAERELADMEADVAARENSPESLAELEADEERRRADGQYPGWTLDLNPTPAHAEDQEKRRSELPTLVPIRMAAAAADWALGARKRAKKKAKDAWQPQTEDGSELRCGGSRSSGEPGAEVLWNGRKWTWVAWDGQGHSTAGEEARRSEAQYRARTKADKLAKEAEVDASGLYKRLDFDEAAWDAAWEADHPSEPQQDAQVIDAAGLNVLDQVACAGKAGNGNRSSTDADASTAQVPESDATVATSVTL